MTSPKAAALIDNNNDELTLPLRLHPVRPHCTESTSNNKIILMNYDLSKTAVQYLKDETDLQKIFRFDPETLGVFGTARQKRRMTEKSEADCKQDVTTPHSPDKKKQPSGRAILHSALDLRSMTKKVIKMIDKNKLPASSGGDRLWRRLCHKLLNLSDQHNGLMRVSDIIETDTHFYLVSERLEGGELFEFLLLERAVPEELCKYLIKQILHSLDFLHMNYLLHRDIKPENLMFRRPRPFINNSADHQTSSPTDSLSSTADTFTYSMNNTSKYKKEIRIMSSLECSQNMSLEELRLQFELAVIDFDTCKMTDVPLSEYQEICNGRRRLVGTYGYLAPEVLKGHEYTTLSDLWSVGIILYILMTGVPPVPMDLMINAKSALEILQQARKLGIDFQLPPFPDFRQAQDLCRALLEFDPARRIASARMALNHPWLTPSATNAVPFLPFKSEIRRQHQLATTTTSPLSVMPSTTKKIGLKITDVDKTNEIRLSRKLEKGVRINNNFETPPSGSPPPYHSNFHLHLSPNKLTATEKLSEKQQQQQRSLNNRFSFSELRPLESYNKVSPRTSRHSKLDYRSSPQRSPLGRIQKKL